MPLLIYLFVVGLLRFVLADLTLAVCNEVVSRVQSHTAIEQDPSLKSFKPDEG